ncbi:CU044_2847 family protein [Glycomyces dulcitolivorans]|uniref:CU044_2847 family protein n=1 Tax=Glycomyces dulcitolivorans TaxID=2200759 RepID=UPI000DD370A6|nr:CU044_2847 family protein [Glycomyces dulcitolivorans]
MGQLVPVKIGDAEFYVEAVDPDDGGLAPISDEEIEPQTFEGIRRTVEAVTGELVQAWEQVRPDEATVTFGVAASLKSGKLTGLLFDAKGEASLQVTLTWKRGAAADPAEPVS